MRFMNCRAVPAGLVAVLICGLTIGGSVTGTVKYEGAVPKLRPIRMDADPDGQPADQHRLACIVTLCGIFLSLFRPIWQ